MIRNFITTILFAAALGAGCSTLLGKKVQPESPPVLAGAASTSDPNAVAWLKYAQLLQRQANPTPSSAPIDVILGSAVTAAAAAAGWYARHKASTPPKQGG
jgi:hypothetical protein